MRRPLYVAKPLLPELDEFSQILSGIWSRRTLTNGGPLHEELEVELSRYLGVPTGKLFNNGTVALLVALRMFDLKPGSEVITTPLTFAATAHAISWNGLKPVFADVSPDTLTLDPESVRAAITNNTSAILPVHVYGTICDVTAFQKISEEYSIPIIYDAAHAFGASVAGRPIGTFGDASVFSFHATKLFHTVEGGMITTNQESDGRSIYYLRNFGIKNEEEVVSIGINGKMNELQAGVGLLTLPLVKEEQAKREKLRLEYEDFLQGMPGIKLQPNQEGIINSQQYFALQIDPEEFGMSRDVVYDSLKKVNIFSRKYFHPICTDFAPYKGNRIFSRFPTAIVQVVKSRVLCLPFHSGVDEEDVARIRSVFLRLRESVAQTT